MGFLLGCGAGFVMWFLYNYLWSGIYTVDQNERAVKTVFGRAQRIEGKTTLSTPDAINLIDEERERYAYPQVVVIPPGGPYFKFPWEEVHKVNIATQTLNMAHDIEDPTANHAGQYLEAVTKDQLNTALSGQIRYKVNEKNLYAYLFGVQSPVVHVMGYFVSVLRERIANFEAKKNEEDGATAGISINDLRKNLHEINEHMMRECTQSAARYGITLEASLITSIDPPDEVESALAAINTAHNEVSSEISLAQASADQKIVQSRRATEIETLRAKSEVEPLKSTADQLTELKKSGPDVLRAYVRNVKLALYSKVKQVIMEVEK
ncbi:MAG: band 7 protein [Candidatus Riflebacteria bacterium HGW-Riflebacteria-1]|jgi:regulator of protease activity HflC (stomatin/prohibitin superfamily)|nr:MAG: band 7 protein [Candidatus Riflebacteria bacterium HGW-Riflebacteria-1]